MRELGKLRRRVGSQVLVSVTPPGAGFVPGSTQGTRQKGTAQLCPLWAGLGMLRAPWVRRKSEGTSRGWSQASEDPVLAAPVVTF